MTQLTTKEQETFKTMAKIFAEHSDELNILVQSIKDENKQKALEDQEQRIAKMMADNQAHALAVQQYFAPAIASNPLFPITDEEFQQGHLEQAGTTYNNLIQLLGLPSHWNWSDGSCRNEIEALCWFVVIANPRIGVTSNGSNETILNDHVLGLTASDLYTEIDPEGKYLSTPIEELVEQAKARLISVQATRSQMG